MSEIAWISMSFQDSGKKFDTMANVSNLAGNPICVVINSTHL